MVLSKLRDGTIESLKTRGFTVYIVSDALAFAVRDKKVVVITKLQLFLLKYDHRNYTRALDRVINMIQEGEITSISQLVCVCDYHIGSFKYQICGIEMVHTELAWLD